MIECMFDKDTKILFYIVHLITSGSNTDSCQWIGENTSRVHIIYIHLHVLVSKDWFPFSGCENTERVIAFFFRLLKCLIFVNAD